MSNLNQNVHGRETESFWLCADYFPFKKYQVLVIYVYLRRYEIVKVELKLLDKTVLAHVCFLLSWDM